MRRRPPRSTRTDTLFPYTTLFRSARQTFVIVLGLDLDLAEVDGIVGLHAAGETGALDRFGAQVIERLDRSEEHTSELQSLMRISYAVFCLKKKKTRTRQSTHTTICMTQTKQVTT